MSSSLPGPVTLAGRRFTFGHVAPRDIDGAYGLCTYSANHLSIAKGQLPIEETDTVIHEVFHAILYAQGREYGGKTEETYVRALATGLTGLLQENPDFLKWLISRFPHK